MTVRKKDEGERTLPGQKLESSDYTLQTMPHVPSDCSNIFSRDVVIVPGRPC